jgi:hypothetical protein
MAEPRMTRRYDLEPPRQAVEKGPVLRDVVAAVQKQERRPGAGDFRIE